MSARRPPPELTFRPVEERDGPILAAFSCSRGAVYEGEAEQFIRSKAFAHALAENTEYRLYVTFEGERLVAVTGHHPEVALVATEDLHTFRATPMTRLQVVALSLRDQGRACSDGRRISDLVMDCLVSEALGGREIALLTTVVARDNLRSITLMERHGLKSQIAYDSLHVRLSARFQRAAP